MRNEPLNKAGTGLILYPFFFFALTLNSLLAILEKTDLFRMRLYMSETVSLERLLYLASLLQGRTPHPQNNIAKEIPRYDVVRSIADHGIAYTVQHFNLSYETLNGMLKRGKNATGADTPSEFRKLASLMAFESVEKNLSLTSYERLMLYGQIDRYHKQEDNHILEKEQVSFTTKLPESQSSWLTGIDVVDSLIKIPDGGFVVIYAKSGAGKTSLMLALANSVIKTTGCRVVYVSLEMKAKSIQNRAYHLKNFRSQDLIVTGIGLYDLEQYCDENTILFIDYADLLTVPNSRDIMGKISTIYLELRRLSLKCKGIFTASQIPKSDKVPVLGSGYYSAEKDFHPDAILGLVKDDIGETSYIIPLKNRFGPVGKKIILDVDYERLIFKSMNNTDFEDDDEELLI